jgi:ABC-type nitrate/sulfonate/bicarbonate transport system substrate-binding protein
MEVITVKKSILPALIILCISALLLAACGVKNSGQSTVAGPIWAPTLAPLSQTVTVKVGMKQAPSDSGVLIGMAKGYYRDLGINIEPVQFNSGQDMINQLAAGHLDVGATVTAAGLFNAMSRDIPVKIVADKGINVPQKGFYRLIIRKNLVDEIKDYSDLRGRKIAIVATASLDEICLDRVLAKGGMTAKDIDMQIIRAFPDMLVALGNNSIDAAMVIEPFVALGIAKNIIDPWKDPAEYDPDAQVAILVYGTKLTTQPEVANRFMTAYVRSMRDYNDAFFKNIGKQEIIDILSKYSVVKDPALYDKMSPAGLNPDGYLRMKGIEMDLAWYRQNNLLKSDIKVTDAVDNQYVDFAIKTLGKYQPK